MALVNITPGMRMLFPPPMDPEKMFETYPELRIVRCFSDLTPVQMAFVSYISDFNSPARVLRVIDKRDETYVRERVCMALGIQFGRQKYYIDKSNDKIEHAIHFFKKVLQDWDEIQHLLDLRDTLAFPLQKVKELAKSKSPTAVYNYKLLMEDVRKEINRNDIGKVNARLFQYLDRLGRDLIKDGALLLYEEETKQATEIRVPASLIKARAQNRLGEADKEEHDPEKEMEEEPGETFE